MIGFHAELPLEVIGGRRTTTGCETASRDSDDLSNWFGAIR